MPWKHLPQRMDSLLTLSGVSGPTAHALGTPMPVTLGSQTHGAWSAGEETAPRELRGLQN